MGLASCHGWKSTSTGFQKPSNRRVRLIIQFRWESCTGLKCLVSELITHSISKASSDQAHLASRHLPVTIMSSKSGLWSMVACVFLAYITMTIGPEFLANQMWAFYEKPQSTLAPVPCMFSQCSWKLATCIADISCRKTASKTCLLLTRFSH